MGTCRRTEHSSACSTWGLGQAHLTLPSGKLLISVGERFKYVLEIFFGIYSATSLVMEINLCPFVCNKVFLSTSSLSCLSGASRAVAHRKTGAMRCSLHSTLLFLAEGTGRREERCLQLLVS